jgi:hypothetical protein
MPGTLGQPVNDLKLIARRGEFVAMFTPIADGVVQLYRSGTPPVFRSGDRIGLRDLPRLGTALAASDPRGVRGELRPGEEIFITPVTILDDTCVVGKCGSSCYVEPVADFTVRPVTTGKGFRAEFAWPAGATEVRVLYRSDRPPDGPDDASATILRLLPNGDRAVVDLRPTAEASFIHINAYALAAHQNRRYLAEPQPPAHHVAVGSRRTVYYTVKPIYEGDRPGWAGILDKILQTPRGRIKAVEIVIAPDELTSLPPLTLYHKPGGRPLSARESNRTSCCYDPKTDPGEYDGRTGLTIYCEFPRALEPGGFRLFPEAGSAQGWRFIDIPK